MLVVEYLIQFGVLYYSFLLGNLKFVVFSVPNNAKWLGACDDICPLVDFVAFWEGCVERFGSL